MVDASAQAADERDARAIMIEAVQRRMVRLDDLEHWVDAPVLVQSRHFHAEGLDWDSTVAAGSDLSTARVVVLGVTPEALTRDPLGRLRRIEQAHAAARRSGTRALVTATPRSTVPFREAARSR